MSTVAHSSAGAWFIDTAEGSVHQLSVVLQKTRSKLATCARQGVETIEV